MAEAFEHLYPPFAQNPSAQRGDGPGNDNFLNEMTGETELAPVHREAGVAKGDSADSRGGAAEPAVRAADSFEVPQPKKTSIEMAFEVLREAEAKGAAARPAPEPPLPSSPPRAQGLGVFHEPENRREPPELAWTQSIAAPEAATPARAWSSRHNGGRAAMIAGGAAALVIGLAVGYMAGRGAESALGRGHVEATETGMRLRLDHDLRQR